MKNFKKNRRMSTFEAQAGFIKMILIIIAALVLLKYLYDIDVIGFLTQGRFRDLLDKFYRLGTEGWVRYKDMIIKVWGYSTEFAKNILNK
jgi:hypothetical protein